MAMPVYSAEDFESALQAAGCKKTETKTATSTIWLTEKGQAFQVPEPYEGYYPDWLIHEVCAITGVPAIPGGSIM